MHFSAVVCARARACEDMLPIIQSTHTHTHTHTFHQEEGPCASQLRSAPVPERVRICCPILKPRTHLALKSRAMRFSAAACVRTRACEDMLPII